MSWRVARAIDTLRKQINEIAPNRSKAADGTIGDAAHAARKSDHNPNAAGIVCAIDITHDPARGMSAEVYANKLRLGGDPRINYIIWNKKIANVGGQWRPNKGHTQHFHVSLKQNPKLYDDPTPFNLGADVVLPEVTSVEAFKPTPKWPTLQKGSTGAEVVKLQELLAAGGSKLTIDGIFGSGTKTAVIAFQKAKGLGADGIVGFYTWKALGR